MDDTRPAFPRPAALARRTGVAEYQPAMFATLVSLPLVSTLIAVLG